MEDHLDKFIVVFMIVVIFALIVMFKDNEKMLTFFAGAATGQLQSLSTLLSTLKSHLSKEEDK